MNPEESDSKITVYGQEILVPSFGRAQPSYPLKIGEYYFMLITDDYRNNIESFLTFLLRRRASEKTRKLSVTRFSRHQAVIWRVATSKM